MPSVSKKQRRFMGLVKSVQEGGTPKTQVGKAVQSAVKSMKPSDVGDFAKTKEKGLPMKKKTTIRFSPAQKVESSNIYARISKM